MDMDSHSSGDSYSGSTRCPLCFEMRSESDKQTRIIHETASTRQHTACTVCLKRLMKDGTQLECPFCRENVEIKLPVEDLPIFEGDDLELTINEATHLKQVVEAVMTVVCTSCEEDKATFRCIDCKFYLCEDCKRTHTKAKRSKMHVLQELNKLSEEEKANFEEVVLCNDHSLVVDMYCPECGVPCCLKCEEHLHHRYVKLKDVLEEKEKNIKRGGKSALEKRDQMMKDVRILKDRKEAVLKCKGEANQEIEATASTIIRNFERQKERLLEQVSKGNDKLTSWFDQEIKTRENILDVMHTVETYFDRKRKIGETKQLELYKRIEEGLERLHSISYNVPPRSENEGYFFQADSNNINDLETMIIGRVYSDSYDDDRISTRGSSTDIRDVDMRVLAIGKKRSGRSQTLIALMTQDVYLNCQVLKGKGFGQWTKQFKGHTYLLSKSPGLDAPGHRDLDMEKSDIDRVTNPGPHVLLLVIKYPDEDVSTLDYYRELFEEELSHFLILVLTGKKELEKRRVSLSTYVRTRDGKLAKLLAAVKGRCIAVNTDDKESLVHFRETLYKMIRELVIKNDLRYLTLK